MARHGSRGRRAGRGRRCRGGGGREGEVVNAVREERERMTGVVETSGSEGNVRATWAAVAKRGCGNKEGDRGRKRLKREGMTVEKEEFGSVDSRYREYLYERWMRESMQNNCFTFSSVSM